MNLIKKVVGAIGLAAFAGVFTPFGAHAGDIYRFEQTSSYTEATPAYVGNEVQFRMILDNTGDDATEKAVNNFALVANPSHPTFAQILIATGGTASTELLKNLATALSAALPQPQLGVMVSGQERFADMSIEPYINASGTTNTSVTVLSFKYTVKTGDYAYPFSPANASGAFPSDTGNFEGYHFTNLATEDGDTVNPWFLMSASGVKANLTFRSPESDDRWVEDRGAIGFKKDNYLSNSGDPIVIEGLGFSDTVSREDGIWREIYEGTSDTYQSSSPSIVLPGGVTSSSTTTLYVWVDPQDETAVVLDPAQSTIHDHNGTNVLYLTVAEGATGASFALRGVSQTGGRDGDGKAQIYISQFPGIRGDTQGVQLSERLTRYVRCVEPPEPYISLVLRNGEGSEADTITAPDWTNVRTPAATITLGLSKIPEADTTLKLSFTAPADDDGSRRDIRDYIGLSLNTQGNSYQDFTDEVTFPAGTEDLTKTVNVFVYDADELTRGKGITIQVAQTAGTPAYTPQAESYSLYINPFTPTITSPDDDTTLGDTYRVGVSVPIEVTVGDTYFNSTNEYKVSFSGGTLEANTVTAVNGTATIEAKFYSTGTIKCSYSLTDKDGRSTAKRYIYVNIDAARTVALARVTEDLTPIEETVHTYAENGDEEITDAYRFRVQLSESLAYGSAIYAFLKPLDEASTNALAAIPNPVRIQPGSTASDSAFAVRFVDGNADTANLAYQVELRTGQDDTASIYDDVYTPSDFYVAVTNVPPQVPLTVYNGAILMGTNGQVRAECANVTIGAATSNMVGNVSLNATKTFYVAQLLEPSAADLAKVDGTGKSTFQTRWSYWYNNQQLGVKIFDGNPLESDEGYSVTFNKAGTWTIQVECRDGDMGRNKWGPSYMFNVIVNPRPYITVTTGYTDERVAETATNVRLTPTISEAADVDLEIQLEVTSADTASATPGIATLSTNTVTISAGSTRPNSYPVFTLDGTPTSSATGFYVTAKVITDALNADGVNYTNLYYQAAPAPMTMYVENEAPVIVNPTFTTTTNEVAIGTATKVSWRVQDVAADVTAGLILHWTQDGASLDVTVKGDKSSSDTASTTVKNAGSNFINGETSFTFTSSGIHVVTLQVEDKDGDISTSRTLYFHCEDSKALKLFAGGPGSGISDSDEAYRYHAAAGRGEGYIWAGSGAYVGNTSFMGTWNFSVTAGGANVFANGYKAGAVHNQAFNASLADDYGISPDGNGVARTDPGAYYEYPGELDSFFYRWIQNDTSGGTAGGTASNYTANKPVPQMTTNAVLLAANIAQNNTSQGGAVNYKDKIIEAVFSREWRASDNMGDINADGIPDYFAVGSGPYSFALGTDDDDLASLATYNDDLKGSETVGDFLPAVDLTTNKAGRNIIPSLTAGWDTKGGAFTARLELRGLHDGLNNTGAYGGKMVSDLDMSEAEFAAFTNYLAKVGNDTAVSTVTTTETQQDGEGNDVDVEVTTTTIDTNAVKQILMSGAWTCENPTNPKAFDTDGDGLGDGYEYFFWYNAVVNDLHGRKFNVEDPSYGSAITPEEIIAAFNPTVYNASAATSDLDGDGLTDLEEFAIGTNPIDWDTDGDFMPDGWEVMHGLNPLHSGADPYGTNLNPDGDAMAYCSYASYGVFTIVHKNGVGCVAVEGDVDITAAGSATGVKVLYNPSRGEFVPCGFAPDGTGGRHMMTAYGTYSTAAGTFEGATISWTEEEMAEAEARGEQLLEKFSGKTLTLIHQQVRHYLGYDPRTGWFINSNGRVSERWGTSGAGNAVNTRPYLNYDEFFVACYLKGVEGVNFSTSRGSDRKEDAWHYFLDNTTCPTPEHVTNDYVEGLLSALGTSADWNQIVHGADTNGDGVPDGWALYVGRMATVPIHQADTVVTNFDDDGLTLVPEYSGSDSCAAFSGVESIASTWNGRWTNKFFPTDPDDDDTDGDGIKDGAEGGSFVSTLRLGSSDYSAATPTGYWLQGSIPGSGTSFRGGGMNPCSIDTDGDGLPDPWEAQYIGRLMRADGQWYVSNYTPSINFLPDSFWVMNGLNDPNHTYASSTNAIPAVDDAVAYNSDLITPFPGAMMVCGMDPTWDGDAGNAVDAYSSDQVTGVGIVLSTSESDKVLLIREVDYDADGLQNFQEYLVQALRHLRYDDTLTPLMGRFIGEGSNKPFATFDPLDEDAFKDTLERLGYDSVRIDAIDYSELGYFTDPPKAWDKEAIAGKKFMLPPKMRVDRGMGYSIYSGGDYVSTDPRFTDTDGDGMDDYYEIFHGLNPLYGKDPDGRTPVSSGGVTGVDVISANLPIVVTVDGENDVQIATPTATDNAWTKAAGYASGEYVPYNPARFPWLNGAPYADCDGDGFRNYEEAILPNVTNPKNYHTDPTPLWFTDPSGLKVVPTDEGGYYCKSENASYVSQYYVMPDSMLLMFTWPWRAAVGTRWVITETDTLSNDSEGAYEGSSGVWMFGFEANEGFDTDADWRSDVREMTPAVEGTSDPLKFTDLDRRQAAYLPGENSVIITREPGYRAISQNDLLKKFTVECWVKPEELKESVILERVAWCTASSIAKDQGKVRANFRIAMNSDGNVYGVVESADAVDSESEATTATVTGPVLSTEDWTHVALSYDGERLALYLNGTLYHSVGSTIIPANGIGVQIQNQVHAFEYPVDEYYYSPCALLIGAQAKTAAAMLLSSNDYVSVLAPAWSDYQRFYKGYVDEVRVWDGARSATDIRADYAKRYTFADVSANREEVYTQWISGARRSGTLPPELVQHYNFSSIPGAVDSADVAQTPSGFEQGVAPNTGDGTIDISAWWWKELADAGVGSTVYADTRVVPWIQNTVQHLPAMDGSARDSIYHGNYYAGFEAPLFMGVTEYDFPNAADPYGWSNFLAERIYRWRRLSTLAGMRSQADTGVDYESLLQRFRFQLRTDFVGTSDMIPLGGAFAKRADTYWDGQGAMDAWADTVEDSDGDGLPDWWEDQYGLSNTEDSLKTMVDYDWGNGTVSITAAEAYLRDLAKGMLPSGEKDVAYIDVVDNNTNGLPDWWETLYGLVDTTGDDDFDSDGLSNRAEYLISEIFQYYLVNPTLPRTLDSNGETVLDFFKKVGQLYLGDMFDDHDKIENAWENEYSAYVDINNRKFIDGAAYDASGDLDEDGWSNWSEARAGKAPVRTAIMGIDGDPAEEYPVPVITMGVYSPIGGKNGSIYVRAWSQNTLGNPVEFDHAPDATWVITSSSATAAAGNGAGAAAATETEGVSREKYIGVNPSKQVSLNLGPGSVLQGTIAIRVKDIAWEVGAFNSGAFAASWRNTYVDNAPWSSAVVVDIPQAAGSVIGDLVLHGYAADAVIGTVDYETGAVDIDFSKLSGRIYRNYVAADDGYTLSSTGIYVSNGSAYSSVAALDLSRSFVKMEWKTKGLDINKTGVFYLSQTESGHVKEGLNTFEAFTDVDGNGVYNPGVDLYGIARNVDVGFESAKFNIELLEVSPVFDRIDILTGVTDRGTLYGTDSGDYTNLVAGVLSGGTKQIVKVVRTAINGIAISDWAAQYPNAFTTNELNQIVMQRIVDFDNRSVLTERDFLSDDALDIDWNNLTNINAKLKKAYSVEIDITNVLYRIVFGNGSTEADNYNNLASVAIARTYDGKDFRDIPVPIAPASNGENAIVYASHPTFVWTTTNMNSYTAFQIQVKDAAKSKTVWDSGIRPLPKRDALGRYVWEAPLYAGDQALDTAGKGAIFGNLTNYTWRVRVMNSKFQDELSGSDGWSDLDHGKFRMNVNGSREIHDGGYSSIAVAVKYRGPAQVLTARGKATDAADARAKVRVQVFSTADFTGAPVSQGVLLDMDSLTNATETVNITLGGIPDGTYYVRAFIDSDGDFKRSNWESWGYASGIGDPADKNYYSPAAIVIDDTTVKAPKATVWIDDCDTDGDWLPDAWEYATGGNLYNGPDKTTADDAFAWYVNVNPQLQATISNRLTSSLTGATLAILGTPQMAALALGAQPADSTAAAAMASIQAIVSPEVEADGISIDSIELDGNGKVYLAISATAESTGAAASSANGPSMSPATATYVIPSAASYQLDCTIYYTSDLSKPFEQLGETRTITVVDGQVQEEFEIDVDSSAPAGFFKAEFTKHK